jgi:hypothetical protein
MVTCSHPTCNEPATRQWQRLLAAEENDGVTQAILTQADLDLAADLKRATHKRIIRELEDARPDVKPELHAHLDRQIAAEQTRHDAVITPTLPVLPDRPNVAAVFACPEHDVDDEKAALLHEPHCLTAAACACDARPHPQVG